MRRLITGRSSSGRDKAVHQWALAATQHDPPSARQYHALREKGHSHGRALRVLADRLLRILIAMLKTSTSYDPALNNKNATP
jgi:hypothetical protein